MNIELITKEEIKSLLQEQINSLVALIHQESIPEWLNDKQCWELKGGCSLNTYRSTRFYQCKGGIPDGYVGGRKAWKKESVLEWLYLSDEQLPEYHKKYKTGVKK